MIKSRVVKEGQSGILGYCKFLDWQLLEFWTIKLQLNIKFFFSKTWKKPNIVKIVDDICKKVNFSKLNVKFIYLFLIIHIKVQNFGCQT